MLYGMFGPDGGVGKSIVSVSLSRENRDAAPISISYNGVYSESIDNLQGHGMLIRFHLFVPE